MADDGQAGLDPASDPTRPLSGTSRVRRGPGGGVRSVGDALGPYRIKATLGSGGMGVVYLAEHATLGHEAAVKTVLVQDPALVSTIRREIQALERMRHPGIVRILEDGIEDGIPWYAMERLTGHTLRHHVRAALSTPLRERLTLVRRLCEPLSYLHGEGMVHRDLKPDNVFVRMDGMPVLVDFGLTAVFVGEHGKEVLQVDSTMAGTVAYMSPEQIRGEVPDARADLYALGCILYELVTGRPPFVAALPGEVVARHIHAEPEPPGTLAPIPAALDELILGLLAKDPRQRIGHADVVAARLATLGAEDGLAASGPKGRPYLYSPAMIGRDTVVSELRDCLMTLREGKGDFVLIGAQSGLGKTRLLVEAMGLARDTGIAVLAGECRPMIGAPLEPLRGPLQEIADLCRAGGQSATERILGRRAKVLAAYQPALRDLPGVDAAPEPEELPADAARERLWIDIGDTLGTLAHEKPLCLVIDDMQWADDLTLGLLEHLGRAGRLERTALLVLCAYRSEESATLAGLIRPEFYKVLELRRLEEASVAAVATDMLAVPALPPLLASYLARHAQGNPFFIAECVRAILAEGLLFRDEDGKWLMAELEGGATEASYEALAIPVGLRDLLLRRLAALSPDGRAISSALAILGREADLLLLSEVAGLTERSAGAGISELLSRDLAQEVRPGAIRLASESVRTIAYDGLPPAIAESLHGRAAAAIEARRSEASVDIDEELGFHHERAGDAGRARECYLAAARSCGKMLAHVQAERCYRSYLSLVDGSTAEGVEARNELAHALRRTGRPREAEDEHRTALAQALVIGDRKLEGESLRGIGMVMGITGRADEALSVMEQALSAARAAGDIHLEAVGLASLGVVLMGVGRTSEARAAHERALAIFRKLGRSDNEETALVNIAAIDQHEGLRERALAGYRQALALLDRLDAVSRRGRAQVLCNMGLLLHEMGRLEEARELSERAVALQGEVGDRRTEGVALGNLAGLLHEMGLYSESGERYEAALRIRRELSDAQGEAIVLGNLAGLRLAQGRHEEARSLFEEALARHRKLGNRRHELAVMGGYAELEMETGDLDAAHDLLRSAIEGLEESEDAALRAHLQGRLALLLVLRGEDPHRADEVARRAEDALRGLHDPKLGSLLCARGLIALAAGRSGRPFLGEAQELLRGFGSARPAHLVDGIARLARAQEAYDAGRPLWCGHDPADVTPGQRRWLSVRRPDRAPYEH